MDAAGSNGTNFLPTPANPSEAMEAGWKETDAQGNGNCVYRDIAAARELNTASKST